MVFVAADIAPGRDRGARTEQTRKGEHSNLVGDASLTDEASAGCESGKRGSRNHFAWTNIARSNTRAEP